MKKIHTPFVFTTLMLILVSAMMVTGAHYPSNVRIFPFVVGIPTLILLFLLWLAYIFPEGKLISNIRLLEEAGQERGGDSQFAQWGQVLNTLAWLLAYYIFIFIFGFKVVTPIFLSAFFYQKTDFRLAKSVLIALVSSFFIIRFVESFGIDLWIGAVPKIIPGIIGGSIIPPL